MFLRYYFHHHHHHHIYLNTVNGSHLYVQGKMVLLSAMLIITTKITITMFSKYTLQL